jgi:hypothetical protein
MLGQLQDMCIKIPLIQSIKEILIYTKITIEICLKNLGRKRKDPQTIHVLGKHADMILGNIIIPKYGVLGIIVVDVKIS